MSAGSWRACTLVDQTSANIQGRRSVFLCPDGLLLCRGGEGTQLLHHAHHVVELPLFGHLPTFEAAYGDTSHRNSLTARRKAHQLTLMATVPAPALHDLVPLGDHIFDGYVEVRKRLTQHQDELPNSFGPSDVLVGFVRNEIRSEYLVDEV